jgi:asparagine synthase (glutamine-hydrolysing)
MSFVVLAGSVRNLRSLAAELGADTCSDEQLLSLAFDRWGESSLTRLRGSFVVLSWNPASRTGFLATDQLGVGALFLHESDGKLWFASELRDLLRLLPRRPPPDDASVVQWLADGYLERGETLFQGVRRLEGGHLVRLDGDAYTWRKLPYWTPRYDAPERLTQGEASAMLRAELERAVGERLEEPSITALLVSGGLDSAAVASAARGTVPSARLRAYSLVFPDHPQADESERIQQLTDALGLPWVTTEAHVGSAMAASLEFQQVWEVPAASPTLDFYLPMLRRAADDGIGVALDGEGGDELFGCSPYLIADLVRRGDLRGARNLARRLPGVGDHPGSRLVWRLVSEFGLKGAAPHELHRVRRTVPGMPGRAPRWLTLRGATEYVQRQDRWAWKRRSGPRCWAYLVDLLTTWREQTGAHDFFRRRSVLAGLETRHPLLDDLGLISLVLRLPPELAFDPHLTRPLLRAALEGKLPDQIRLRPDKSEFSALLVGALSGPDRAIVSSLLRASDAASWEFVDPAWARGLLDVPLERRNFTWAQQVWRIATTECWLRSQEDEEFSLRVVSRAAAPST